MWIAITIVIAVFAFLAWRITSVGRGAKKRDTYIYEQIEGIARLLERGQDVQKEMVLELGEKHELRGMLYFFLKQGERLDLAPDDWKSVESQGKAQLAYWMLHPNELDHPAEDIQIVSTHERMIDDQQATFLCLKYRMPQGHWAGEEWQLGVAGPYFEHSLPYDGEAGAFARVGDKEGDINPDALVDRYIRMATGKPAEP